MKKSVNKIDFIRNFLIVVCILIAGVYLINREIKINDMKKDLKEVGEMNKNLENLNKDLETEIKTVQEIIEELENNE